MMLSATELFIYIVHMVVQLLLAALGGLIMLATAAFMLPGVPVLMLFRLIHYHPAPLTWLQGTRAYKAAAALVSSISSRLLVDSRNKELLVISVVCAAGTTALTCNIIYRQISHPDTVPWAAILLRHAFMTGMLPTAFAAKHRESHNRTATYKHPLVQSLLGRVNEWWTGVLYGNIPEIDRCGHGFVHHRNELENDDWSNCHLNRGNLFSFLQFVVTAAVLHNSGVGPLLHFKKANLPRLVRQMATGMVAYCMFALATWLLGGWKLFAVLVAWPFIANFGYVSVVNWTWHAFADPADPSNYVGSTTTALGWPGDIFAEGIHVPHHLKAASHYTSCRHHYDDNKEFYAAHNCIVLHNTEPVDIWVNLMLHNWGYFAARMVDFSGAMTFEQKRAFVRYRTRPAGSKPANEFEVSAAALAAGAAAKAAKWLASDSHSTAAAVAAADGAASQAFVLKGGASGGRAVVHVKAY